MAVRMNAGEYLGLFNATSSHAFAAQKLTRIRREVVFERRAVPLMEVPAVTSVCERITLTVTGGVCVPVASALWRVLASEKIAPNANADTSHLPIRTQSLTAPV